MLFNHGNLEKENLSFNVAILTDRRTYNYRAASIQIIKKIRKSRNCKKKCKNKDDTNLIPTANTSTIGKTSTFSPELKRSLKTSRPESPDVTRAAKRLERSRQQKNGGDSRLDTTATAANGGPKVHNNECDDLKSEYIEINSDNNIKSTGGNDSTAAKVFMCDVHKRKQNGSTTARSTKLSCNNTTNVVTNIIENPAAAPQPQPQPPLSQSSSASNSPPILPPGEGGGAAPPPLEKSEMLGAISKTSKRLVFDHFTKRL